MTQEIAALFLFLFTLGIVALISINLNKKTIKKRQVITKEQKKRKFKVINGGKNG